MAHRHLIIITLILSFCCSGCAVIGLGGNRPQVRITAVKIIPSRGIAPEFDINVRVINPAASPVRLRGVSYTMTIENHEIITGAGNNLPLVEPYSQVDFTIHFKADMAATLQLLADIAGDEQQQFDYNIDINLDTGRWSRNIHAAKQGVVTLRALTR